MNQSIAWETFFQKKVVKISDKEYPLDLPAVRRNDGFTLTLEAGTQEGRETFLCEGNFKSFRFYAHRGYADQHNIYYVELKANNRRHWVNNPDPLEPIIRQHAQSIREALLHFPSLPPYKDIQVEDVVFSSRNSGEIQEKLRGKF